MRLIVAAILAGIVMFAWGAVSHMVLGIGDAGITPMPNEAAVSAALKSNLTEPGLYFMPGIDMRHATEEQRTAFAAKYKEGPTAMLVYQPTGEDPMSFRQFGIQLASDMAAAFVAAMILSLAGAGFSRGVTIAALIGMASWLAINVPYWNWYRFPTNFTTAQLIDQLGRWLAAGFVLGFILRRRN
jgi:hypothetical protein